MCRDVVVADSTVGFIYLSSGTVRVEICLVMDVQVADTEHDRRLAVRYTAGRRRGGVSSASGFGLDESCYGSTETIITTYDLGISMFNRKADP